LRAVEPDKYIFFEPLPAPVTFGLATNLTDVKDARASSRIVYAPHCYPYDTHEGLGYTATSRQQLKDWERERNKDVKRFGNTTLLTGEFGLSPTQAGFEEYLTDFNAMSDRNLWHWAYWSSDRGGWGPTNPDNSESPILPHLIRAYPKATAGKLNSFSFDVTTKKFVMEFTSNSAIIQPTEVFIPRRYFPAGYNLTVTGTTDYTQEFDAARQLLKFVTADNNTTITLEISPK
jgi:endoglycosylceramidase